MTFNFTMLFNLRALQYADWNTQPCDSEPMARHGDWKQTWTGSVTTSRM